MAVSLTSNTFNTTYKDDFLDSDNYHRILFNAGKALQARELTQLQTIINREVERFGRNIFKEGALVRPGGVVLETKREFIKLVNGSTDFNDIQVGDTFNATNPNGVIFDVIEKLPASSSDPTNEPDTLYVRYTNTTAGTAGTNTPIRVADGATLNGPNGKVVTAAASNATGTGTKVSVNEGDYFVQGHFVFADQQSLIVSRYTSNPTKDVGFKIVENIISSSDDASLFDNQGATPNIAAPGADRYQIKLTLTTRDQVLATENFVYLAKIDNGKIVDQIAKEDIYNTIGDFIALRTKEESGDYVVSPFRASFNNLNDSNLSLDVSSGVAYVDGYRISVPQQTITVPKARSTVELTNQKIPAGYGNYVRVKTGQTFQKGLPNIDTLEKQNLRDATGYGGNTIGTARVRNIEEDGGNLRFYLLDVRMNIDKSFGDTRSIGIDATSFADIELESGVATLKETNNNSLIFPLPNKSPTLQEGITASTLDYDFRALVRGTASGGTVTFNAPDNSTFSGAIVDYVSSAVDSAVNPTGNHFKLDFTGQTTGGPSIEGSGAQNGKVYEMVATFTNTLSSANNIRTKTLAESTLTVNYNTATGTGDSTGGGQNFIDLGKADCYKLVHARISDSNGADVSNLFTFDDGQRDNYYARGRLLQKPGTTVATNNIFIRFQHFNHTANPQGSVQTPAFFNAESYKDAFTTPTMFDPARTGNNAYTAIPSFQKADGTVISLRDAFDFRPVQGSHANSTYFNADYDSSNGIINYLPRPTSSIGADITHFKRRKDKLIAVVTNTKDDRDGAGKVILQQGVSSIDDAQEPNTPTGSLTLYNFNLNPFTFNESDLTSEFISNKRFTMQDIGRLENRINKIEELTTLNLLELDASSVSVIDSAGLERTKSGFLADNFSDEKFSDTINDDYKASVDFDRLTLRPQVWPKSVRMAYNSSNATNIVNKGDFLLLNINSHINLINQDLATETVNVNPFAVITNEGHLEMSPSSDDWVEVDYIADNVVNAPDNVTRRRTRNTFQNLANWRNSWFGTRTGGTGVGSRVDVIVSSDVVRDTIADRLLEVTIIPWMRSRKIGFRAQGLQPQTQYYAFFGNQSMADWVKSTTFSRAILDTDEDGNIYNNVTSHPDGSSTLITDAEGKIEGTFVIPSTPSLRFRTGTQQFKLLNITANNDADATSIAITDFSSQGIIETRQRTVRVTRNIVTDQLVQQQRPRDPLAQSFRVDHVENPNGVFISQIGLFFESKDTTVPVQVQIRAMEAGVPTGFPIPGAVKFLSPSSVNVQPLSSANITNVRAAETIFEFDEPVYLSPGVDYAVVIMAESVAYNVYVTQTGQFIIGSTEARITKQPTLGSLFLSQNARTWTPDQNRDLMFRIKRADFASSGNVVLSNNNLSRYALDQVDPFESENSTKNLRIFHQGHGFSVGDRVQILGLPSAAYNGVQHSDINGQRQITKADWTGYTVEVGGSANFNTTGRFGGTGTTVTQNLYFDTFFPSIQTLIPDQTTLTSGVKTTRATSYADETSKRTSGSNFYSKSGVFTDITLNEFNTLNSPKVVLSDSNESILLAGAKSFDLQLSLTTSDSKVSPVIDMQRASLIGFENIIDKQVSAGSGGNIPISFVDETSSIGGSSAAKHITTPIELASAAVGLKIILAASRPGAADFKVYFRTATADEVITSKPFVEIAKEADLPPDEDGLTFRDYEYLAGGQIGNLSSFTQFQIKIVMETTNSSRVPVFKDLRAIALVT